jgi:zinc finger HIT domain-containing protein 3
MAEFSEHPEELSAHDHVAAHAANELPSSIAVTGDRDSKRAAKSGVAGCVVCGSEDLSKKYRCPRCRSPYCSLACCKEHKTICAISTEPAIAGVSQGPRELPRGNKRPRTDDDVDAIAEENGWKLSEEQLLLIKSSTSLKSSLQNSRLRELILKVDGAKDRERALVAAIAESRGHKGSDLESFLQFALRSAGCYEKRPDGSEFLRPKGSF